MQTATHNRMMTTDEAAEYLGTTRPTLETWRCTKRVDLPYCKVGHAVRYRLSDLDAFIESRMVRGGDEQD